jgi:hypothetical protein
MLRNNDILFLGVADFLACLPKHLSRQAILEILNQSRKVCMCEMKGESKFERNNVTKQGQKKEGTAGKVYLPVLFLCPKFERI